VFDSGWGESQKAGSDSCERGKRSSRGRGVRRRVEKKRDPLVRRAGDFHCEHEKGIKVRYEHKKKKAKKSLSHPEGGTQKLHTETGNSERLTEDFWSVGTELERSRGGGGTRREGDRDIQSFPRAKGWGGGVGFLGRPIWEVREGRYERST